MAKYTTHREDFTRISRLNKVNSLLFWALLVLNVLPEILKLALEKPESLSGYVPYLNYLLVIGFVSSFVIYLTVDYFLVPVAESKRRADYFGNSFALEFQLQKSEEYFTNEEIGPGYYKMAVNLFQNLFFTTSVARLMIPKVLFKAAIWFLIFISISFIGINTNAVFIIILQAIFSVSVFGHAIKFFIYNERKKNMMKQMHLLFSNPTLIKDPKCFPEILKLYTDYECNISWGLISLDGKVFNKNNDSLEQEWANIKSKYKIQ